MKSITQFPSHLLTRGIEAKAALLAEGKTPEEIQTSLGEAFKLEGDRLKHFFNSLDFAAQNAGLLRMMVMTLAEGEKVPPKSIAIEGHHYVAEFLVLAQPQQPGRDGKGGHGRGRQGRGGRGGGGSKGSPWGSPPPSKAGKNGGGKAPGGV